MTRSPDTAIAAPRLTAALTWTMAIASGVAVANLYYNQPLLADMARAVRVSPEQIGWVAMLTQIGYAGGMLLFVPLGDALERRQLNVIMCAVSAAALIGVALAPNFSLLALTSLAVGLTSVVPQMLVPFAAYLAAPEERGRSVGMVMSGLLIGILLARTLSGYVGAQLGWRNMYWIASGMMVVLAVVLALALPDSRPRAHMPYGELMKSLVTLVRREPQLRESALVGAMMFGCFSAFWATLVFLLEGAPYHYGSQAAGLFGLVGVVGASAASLAGRLADVHHPRHMLRLALIVTAVSFLLFWTFGHQLWGVVVGVVLLDAGVQGGHVTNQTRIYRLLPEAQNRINTVYMVVYFVGGSIGTTLAAHAWEHWGWAGVCGVSLGMLVIAGMKLMLPMQEPPG